MEFANPFLFLVYTSWAGFIFFLLWHYLIFTVSVRIHDWCFRD